MKVPKTDQLEQILDKINSELDYNRKFLRNPQNQSQLT